MYDDAVKAGQDMVKAVKVLQRFYRLKKYRRGHGPMVTSLDLTKEMVISWDIIIIQYICM